MRWAGEVVAPSRNGGSKPATAALGGPLEEILAFDRGAVPPKGEGGGTDRAAGIEACLALRPEQML